MEERLSRLEGAYEHLATKADLAELRSELRSDVAGLRADLFDKLNVHMRWMIGIQIASLVAIVAVLRFLEQ